MSDCSAPEPPELNVTCVYLIHRIMGITYHVERSFSHVGFFKIHADNSLRFFICMYACHCIPQFWFYQFCCYRYCSWFWCLNVGDVDEVMTTLPCLTLTAWVPWPEMLLLSALKIATRCHSWMIRFDLFAEYLQHILSLHHLYHLLGSLFFCASGDIRSFWKPKSDNCQTCPGERTKRYREMMVCPTDLHIHDQISIDMIIRSFCWHDLSGIQWCLCLYVCVDPWGIRTNSAWIRFLHRLQMQCSNQDSSMPLWGLARRAAEEAFRHL